MNTIYLLISSVAIGTICYNYAQKRGRNPYTWLGIGLIFGFLGLLTLFLLPPLKVQSSRGIRRGTMPGKHPAPAELKISLETLDPSHLNTLWYYLDHNHDQFGPMSIDALSRAWKEGKITQATFVWNEFMENWKHFEEVLKTPKIPVQTSYTQTT